MKEPFVSIIILNHNGLNDLKECFDSLHNLNYKNYELILVDNNSQDGSADEVRKNYSDVKIIKLKKNYGFAKGNNLGIPHARGKYIVLLNMDTVVDKNWIRELVAVAEKSKKIGIVGSKIYYYNNKTTIDFAGAFCNEYGVTVPIGILKKDNELLNMENKAFFICGAALLLRRELYDKIGLFDPTYFAYYEDVDFCWRAWISSYDVIIVPKSYIYHKMSRVIKDTKRKRNLIERNKLRTLLKNYERKTLIKILPTYFYKQLKTAYRTKDYKSCDLVITYLIAILWNFTHIFSLIKNRIKVQKNRKRSDKFIFKLMKDLEDFAKKV